MLGLKRIQMKIEKFFNIAYTHKITYYICFSYSKYALVMQ